MRYFFSAFAALCIFCFLFLFLKTSYLEGMTGFDLPIKEDGNVLGVNETVFIPEIEPEADTAFNLDTLGLPDMALPVKTTDIDLMINEGAGVVLDAGSGKIIFSKDHEKRVPIASITKLATVMVFMDHNPGWEKEYTINSEDRVEGGTIYLYRGDRVSLKTLFELSLIASDNMAAKALMRSSGLGNDLFVEEMNRKMQDLGLLDTSFAEVSGLSAKNISTPYETAKLIKAALKVDEIRKALLTEKYQLTTLDGRTKTIHNTNLMLSSYKSSDFVHLGGKTGYTESAGFCFVGMFANNDEEEIITVFLGGNHMNSRFENSKKMADWTFSNHEWR
jgi:D-alanyl-D-alanine carboxypeptidase